MAKSVLSLVTKTAVAAATVWVAKQFFSAGSGSQLDLSGKIVLITGGSRGLGLALALELGSRGARLALCARDPGELDEARERLARGGIESAVFACDIARQPEITSLVERVVAHFGRIDVLINNAGIIKVGPLESLEYSDFEDAMSTMFWAPVNLSFAVLPHMRQHKSGAIVNITSVGGRVSVPHLLPYSCAKFALVGFSNGLAAEVRADDIHILTVVPGLMRTGSYLNVDFAGAPKEEFAWFSLLGNLPGFSVAAEYAASSIRHAIENRRRTLTISLPAKLLIASDALLPEVTRCAMEFVNHVFLPAAKTSETARGKSMNPVFGAVFQALTSLGKSAALRFNE